MPTYQDSESAFQIVPEGDYILAVCDYSSDLSGGQKTRGCERFNLVFNIEGTHSKLRETFIDHESCIWKLDTFLKSAGIRKLKKGQGWHFEKDKAEELGVPWINPMGLRCHAHVVQDNYTGSMGNTVTKNKVSNFFTDRSALPPDAELRKKPMTKAESLSPDLPPSVEGDEDAPF